jgi:NADPH:quinone reductase-like Zn-dependent oxidoreductase
MGDTMRAFGLADETSSAAFLEMPVPEVGPGEVRVRVRASSVNGFDVFVAAGMARGSMEHRYPVIVGKDYAGDVDAVGDRVDRFALGDAVMGIIPPTPHLGPGAYAEFLTIPATDLIEAKPANLDLEQAASVGLAALSGLVCVDQVAPSDGSKILIVGATGGVGTYAVQLAAARGATVVATALPDDEEWIRGLGATETVDYSGNVPSAIRERHPDGIDGLIVAVHVGEEFEALAGIVKDGGTIASTVGGADVGALASRGIVAENVVALAYPQSFTSVVAMAAEEALTVPTTETYGFDELPEALGLVGKRRSRGKVAVRIA